MSSHLALKNKSSPKNNKFKYYYLSHINKMKKSKNFVISIIFGIVIIFLFIWRIVFIKLSSTNYSLIFLLITIISAILILIFFIIFFTKFRKNSQ